MTCFVPKDTPISIINSRCHIKKLKSSRICLHGYLGFISHEIVFNSLGVDTHTHTSSHMTMRNKTSWSTDHEQRSNTMRDT